MPTTVSEEKEKKGAHGGGSPCTPLHGRGIKLERGGSPGRATRAAQGGPVPGTVRGAPVCRPARGPYTRACARYAASQRGNRRAVTAPGWKERRAVARSPPCLCPPAGPLGSGPPGVGEAPRWWQSASSRRVGRRNGGRAQEDRAIHATRQRPPRSDLARGHEPIGTTSWPSRDHRTDGEGPRSRGRSPGRVPPVPDQRSRQSILSRFYTDTTIGGLPQASPSNHGGARFLLGESGSREMGATWATHDAGGCLGVRACALACLSRLRTVREALTHTLWGLRMGGHGAPSDPGEVGVGLLPPAHITGGSLPVGSWPHVCVFAPNVSKARERPWCGRARRGQPVDHESSRKMDGGL